MAEVHAIGIECAPFERTLKRRVHLRIRIGSPMWLCRMACYVQCARALG